MQRVQAIRDDDDGWTDHCALWTKRGLMPELRTQDVCVARICGVPLPVSELNPGLHPELLHRLHRIHGRAQDPSAFTARRQASELLSDPNASLFRALKQGIGLIVVDTTLTDMNHRQLELSTNLTDQPIR
jgi:hypothetical protein